MIDSKYTSLTNKHLPMITKDAKKIASSLLTVSQIKQTMNEAAKYMYVDDYPGLRGESQLTHAACTMALELRRANGSLHTDIQPETKPLKFQVRTSTRDDTPVDWVIKQTIQEAIAAATTALQNGLCVDIHLVDYDVPQSWEDPEYNFITSNKE